MLILVLGGIRSGKSAHALELAAGGGDAVTYLATGVSSDPGMARRIDAHRTRRPDGWTLVEEPLAIARATPSGAGTVLLESVDGWLGNLMEASGGVEAASEEWGTALVERASAQLEELEAGASRLVAVSAEVGLAPVPLTAYGRVFVDALGELNQRLAGRAGEVWLVVAGIATPLRRGA